MLIHLNGHILQRNAARIDPFDRGFIFGEGVYEGLRAIAWKDSARIVGLKRHTARMQSGLDAAGIDLSAAFLERASADILQANNLRDAFIYWQVTGGAPGEGDPARSRVRGKNTRPTVFGYCSPQPPLEAQTIPATKKVITIRDTRWELGWLKSISLMGNVLAARQADQHACDEAILIRGGDESGRGGFVSEGLATNLLVALPDSQGRTEIVTPALNSAPMLAGVTRHLLCAWEPTIHQRPVLADDLDRATEIMHLGTTTMVSSVIELNGRRVGDGAPGPESRRLLKTLVEGLRSGRDIE